MNDVDGGSSFLILAIPIPGGRRMNFADFVRLFPGGSYSLSSIAALTILGVFLFGVGLINLAYLNIESVSKFHSIRFISEFDVNMLLAAFVGLLSIVFAVIFLREGFRTVKAKLSGGAK